MEAGRNGQPLGSPLRPIQLPVLRWMTGLAMKLLPLRLSVAALALVIATALAPVALAAKPTPAEALKLQPVQKDVEFDTPTAEEAAKAVVDVETIGGITGWVVRTDSGQVLRRFLDTNGDNKVDQWCYFKDGIETYRDIDGDFNNKADQYRWLGTAGTRWGTDKDENGRMDSWKIISAEEVTSELVAALRDRDSARFDRLLLTDDELTTLGVSKKQKEELTAKITAAAKQFADAASKQKLVSAKSEWVHFGASRPGVVPAGTEGASKDIVVYDNVTAVVETDGKHGQLVIGTLVKVGDAWRIFDLPKNLTGDQTAAASVGYFFQASFSTRPDVEAPSPASSVSAEMQKLIVDLEKLDKQIATAKSATEQTRLHATRSDLAEQIIQATTTADDRAIWVRQYAETLSAAVQSGAYPEGAKRLQRLLTAVKKLTDAADLVPYVQFRQMEADYNLSTQDKTADFEKLNDAWMASLEQFVKDFPTSPDAAEAMLRLGILLDYPGKEEEAAVWFKRIAKEFPQSDLAPKASGAVRRLESVGNSIPLKSKTLDGRTFDLTGAKDRVVLIHYWATWAEPCVQDLDAIKALQAKYGKDGFYPVGVNLDAEAKEASAMVRSKTIAWPQLYETGGLDSRLATELGVLTLPMMILVGKDGKVISRNIHAGELDSELKKLLR
jgi:TolA-binding protein